MMTSKMQAKDAQVDWDHVNAVTERRRTYEIILPGGGIIFKYYKPSEMKKLQENMSKPSPIWKKVKLVGRLP